MSLILVHNSFQYGREANVSFLLLHTSYCLVHNQVLNTCLPNKMNDLLNWSAYSVDGFCFSFAFILYIGINRSKKHDWFSKSVNTATLTLSRLPYIKMASLVGFPLIINPCFKTMNRIKTWILFWVVTAALLNYREAWVKKMLFTLSSNVAARFARWKHKWPNLKYANWKLGVEGKQKQFGY